MAVLQIEHGISDYETWKRAFDRDPLDRAGSGVRAFRIFRPLDDEARIRVDLEFDTAGEAESFKSALEGLWSSGAAAPALAGEGHARVVEEVAAQRL